MARDSSRSRKRVYGFTLIELMIAVAIIGILTAIAVPNYNRYLIKSNRSAAQQYMLSVSNMQEQYLLDNRAYADPDPDTDIAGVLGSSMAPPADLAAKYTFSIANPSAGEYTITATAIGSQAGDGNLTLDNTGAKTPVDKW